MKYRNALLEWNYISSDEIYIGFAKMYTIIYSIKQIARLQHIFSKWITYRPVLSLLTNYAKNYR